MTRVRVVTGVIALLSVLLLLPVVRTARAGASTTTTVTSTPGSTWGVFAPCPSKPSENCGAIYSIVNAGGVVYIGGSFTELISPNGEQSLPYQDLAAITESTGQPDTAFGPHTFNGPVDALAVSPDGSELYAGGQFTTIDGSTAHAQYLAAFSSGNGAHLAFPGSTNGAVYALLTSGTSLYVGGVFWRADGQWQPHAAELAASSGALDQAFAPQIAYSGPTSPCYSRFACRASVHSFYLGTDANGAPTLYLGGEFTSVGGQARFDLAAVDPSTGAVTSYDPHIIQYQDDAMDWVSQVVQDGSEVVAGEAGYNNILIAFGLSGQTLWHDVASGDIQAVAVDSSGHVYAGGHFNCWCNGPRTPPPTGPDERIHLARVSATTGALDSTWAPFYEPWWSPYFFGVWALDITPDGDLWAGGEGTYIKANGLTYPAPKLAVFR